MKNQKTASKIIESGYFYNEMQNNMFMLQNRIRLLERLQPNLQEMEQWQLLSTDIRFIKEQLHNAASGSSFHTRIEKMDLLDVLEDSCESFEAACRINQIQLNISFHNAELPSVTDFVGDYNSVKASLLHLLTEVLHLVLHAQNSMTDSITVIKTNSKIIPLFKKRTIYVHLEGKEDAALIHIGTDAHAEDPQEFMDRCYMCEELSSNRASLSIKDKGNFTHLCVAYH